MTAPEPLTPPECDLRDYPWMPLDVSIVHSEMFVLGTGEQCTAAFVLMIQSWLQVPAGSIPSDERILADLSKSGRRWNRVRAHALRDWVLCSDGRLYHPGVCERALAIWPKVLRLRARVIRRLEMESGLWSDLRRAVFLRDDFTCSYCGRRGVKLECDHIVPLSKGGVSAIENLTTACRSCNRSKHAKSLAEWVR